MLPESLVIAVDIDPLGVHVREHTRFTVRRHYASDVCVCAAGIAVGVIGYIKMIGPEAMDGP